jgi:hypothetical protein
MPPRIQVGTILIEDRPFVIRLLNLESQSYSRYRKIKVLCMKLFQLSASTGETRFNPDPVFLRFRLTYEASAGESHSLDSRMCKDGQLKATADLWVSMLPDSGGGLSNWLEVITD